jgi:predicted pyridoxine 5'-phosphate oxidase superfamily flavin-nucleotide-binding protein
MKQEQPAMSRAFADIAFTPSVRAAQERQGAAKSAERFLSDEIDRRDQLTDNEASFIVERDGFYLGTVTEDGWPYIQFRGGPQGFMRVLDEKTIAWADFRGNRQYLSVGNLAANDRVSLFLMDYPNRRRLKLWGRAQIVETSENEGLVKELFPDGYKALPERAVVVTVEAFDWNCPQPIPQRLTAEEWEAAQVG